MADYREWDRLVGLFRKASPNIAKAFDQAKAHSVRQDAELEQARLDSARQDAALTALSGAVSSGGSGRIEGGVMFHGQWNITNGRRDAVMDKIAAGNFGWFRVDIEWAYIEQVSKGVYTSEGNKLDYLISGAHSRGLKVLGMFLRTPTWANGSIGDSYPPTDIDDWTDFCSYAATRWAFDAFQIWNEPNPAQAFFSGTVPQYCNLVKAAYPVLKAIRPNSPVVLGGPSTHDADWLDDVYAEGTKNYFDILSTQPYQSASNLPPNTVDSPPQRWNYMHFPYVLAVMNAYGDGQKDVWFTEFGYSSHANVGGEDSWELGVTEAQQAAYTIQAFEIARAQWPNVKKIFVYKIDNHGGASGSAGINAHQDNFGLLYNDLTNKPAYTALQAYLGVDSTPAVPSFPATGILSNFTGADENPISEGGNWDNDPNSWGAPAWRRLSNAMRTTTISAQNSVAWVPTFGPDMETYCTVVTKPPNNGGYIQLGVRWGIGAFPASFDGYSLRVTTQAGDDVWQLTSNVDGTPVNLGVDANREYAAGDRIALKIDGTQLTAYHYSGGSWTQVATASDSTITGTGHLAFHADPGASGYVEVDDFGGGTIA